MSLLFLGQLETASTSTGCVGSSRGFVGDFATGGGRLSGWGRPPGTGFHPDIGARPNPGGGSEAT